MTIPRGRPFLGGDFSGFEGAFPNVEKLEMTIEREERFHDGRLGCEWSTHTYTEKNVPDQIACSSNPPCLRGGYDIQEFLRWLREKRKPGENEVQATNQIGMCAGDHGSEKERRPGQRCSIQFKVSAKMIFKQSQKDV